MSMFINFDTDEMYECEIHSLKQEIKKLKIQIEERDFCIRELQMIIEQIQKTLEKTCIGDVIGDVIYEAFISTKKSVNSAILLCKNSADSVIEKIKEYRRK